MSTVSGFRLIIQIDISKLVIVSTSYDNNRLIG